MDGDFDLELSNDTTEKKRKPRVGRRAKAEKEADEGNNDEKTKANDDDVPPKPSKRGGWGEDSVPKSARRRGGDEEGMDELDDSDRLKPHTVDLEDDIPVIPDLDDQPQAEESNSTMAHAPSVAVNKVATYRELDHDLAKHAPFATLDNEIDLKLLMKCLCSEGDVQETDETWEWDRLFTEVTSDLLTVSEGDFEDKSKETTASTTLKT